MNTNDHNRKCSWNIMPKVSSALARRTGRYAPYSYALKGMAAARYANPRLAAAQRIVGALYRNRDNFSKAAIMFRKSRAIWRQKRARFSKTKVGSKPNSSTCKKVQQIPTQFTNQSTRSLFNQNLTAVVKGTGIRERDRSVATV